MEQLVVEQLVVMPSPAEWCHCQAASAATAVAAVARVAAPTHGGAHAAASCGTLPLEVTVASTAAAS